MICVVDSLPTIQAWAAWFVASANLRGTAAGRSGMIFERSGGARPRRINPLPQAGPRPREAALDRPNGATEELRRLFVACSFEVAKHDRGLEPRGQPVQLFGQDRLDVGQVGRVRRGITRSDID